MWQVDASIEEEKENNRMTEGQAVESVRSKLTGKFQKELGSHEHFFVSARDMFKGTSRMDEVRLKDFLLRAASKRLTEKDAAVSAFQ